VTDLRPELRSWEPARAGLGEVCGRSLLALASLCSLAGLGLAESPDSGGLAILAAKALLCELEGEQLIERAVVLVQGNEIEAVGRQGELAVPSDYEVYDAGDSWVMPGMIDLHSHVGGPRGYNDMVFQVNSGLRVSATVIAGNPKLARPVAAGITTILYIPGSGTNVGGQGILMKTKEGAFEDVVLRNPGSLKIAQGDNPKRWGYTMQRGLMNHHIRYTLRQGKAYAERWAAFERGEGPEPERHLNLDVYRDLFSEEIGISTHTQYYQVVLSTLRILRMEFGFPTFIDHGSFDSWRLGALAEEIGVPAILGPRQVMFHRAYRFDTDGQVQGSAWGFQKSGTRLIGFNTDAPVMPQEELPLQSAMGVRYGFDNSELGAVRGLTIVPAVVAGIADRVGSLEPGKQADLVVISGDPSDPRSVVERVWIDGELEYEWQRGAQRW
jgi:imidazolonepropionase-like amidohydrolase